MWIMCWKGKADDDDQDCWVFWGPREVLQGGPRVILFRGVDLGHLGVLVIAFCGLRPQKGDDKDP